MKKNFLFSLFFFTWMGLNAQIVVKSNNNVGIGYNMSSITALEALHVNGSIYLPGATSLYINSNTDNYCRLRLHNNAYDSYIDFYPHISFRSSYSPYGLSNVPLFLSYASVGINNNNPSCALDVSGTIKMNGLTVTSDERLKDNIQSMTSSLSTLSRLRGVTYTLKPINSLNLNNSRINSKITGKPDSIFNMSIKRQGLDSAYMSRNHMGFLAQEVQNIYPDLVYTDNNGILSVDYISLIPVLAESIKELSQKVDSLAKENEELKRKINKSN